ncbi:hypothetical protein DPMN_038511 [Dreissena polymorpha]|uniref:Uncharacterized protein n=1 Tax=Dreissena polymorpha TaxID=45954 RepID=A0A9D4RQB7_DREPO|nr:hypothetical protein DPMN_038511 [Dreissena polymorpha]
MFTFTTQYGSHVHSCSRKPHSSCSLMLTYTTQCSSHRKQLGKWPFESSLSIHAQVMWYVHSLRSFHLEVVSKVVSTVERTEIVSKVVSSGVYAVHYAKQLYVSVNMLLKKKS